MNKTNSTVLAILCNYLCAGMGEAEVHLVVRGRVHLTETKGT